MHMSSYRPAALGERSVASVPKRHDDPIPPLRSPVRPPRGAHSPLTSYRRRKARELKQEEEEEARKTKHAKKVRDILDQLTAEEIQAQNTLTTESKHENSHKNEMMSHQSSTLKETSEPLEPRRQHLPESGEGKGQAKELMNLQILQKVAAEALAKQFSIPIAMAETAAQVVEKALVEAAQNQNHGAAGAELCEIDPADL